MCTQPAKATITSEFRATCLCIQRMLAAPASRVEHVSVKTTYHIVAHTTYQTQAVVSGQRRSACYSPSLQ